jgi:hypothetical protein
VKDLTLASFKRLQWLFPVAVTLHNAEEAIWMPGWVSQHGAQLPVHPPGAPEIRLALAALTMAAFAVTYLSVREGPQSVWAYLTFGYIVAMLVNVFVPHIPATVALRSYTPGVITAGLINLPVMGVLALRALHEGWVSGWKAAAFAVSVPLAIGGAIVAILWTTEVVR